MSLRSESSFVRYETIKNLKNDKTNLEDLKSQLETLKTVEKNEAVLEILNSI